MTDAHEDSNAGQGFTFSGYDRGHPWHYLERGDGAAPVTPDQIPVAAVEIAGGYLVARSREPRTSATRPSSGCLPSAPQNWRAGSRATKKSSRVASRP